MSLLFALLMLLAPLPTFHWDDQGRQSLSLNLSGSDPSLTECLNSGLPLRYQYSVQLCEVDSAWFDSCGPQRELVKTARFSPVAEQYVIESEGSLGAEQSKVIVSDLAEATAALMALNGIELQSLLESSKERLRITQDTVLRVRVVSVCEGEVADVFAHLSYFVTMGMYRMSGFNSGWLDIPLNGIAHKGEAIS
jgi:hypothetical protein